MWHFLWLFLPLCGFLICACAPLPHTTASTITPNNTTPPTTPPTIQPEGGVVAMSVLVVVSVVGLDDTPVVVVGVAKW